jgi:hypothetical protein
LSFCTPRSSSRGDRGRQLVVCGARERGARRRVENLHARRRQRQDLQSDARRVHVGDAARTQVL